MSKFKVGDKVALATSPDEEIGKVNCIVGDTYGCHIFVAFNEKKVYEIHLAGYNYEEDKLVKVDEFNLTDDEIYTMLKPKMEKSGAYVDRGYYYELDNKKAIALAYRSGYLRTKKGRPFKIGESKCK